MRSTKIDDSHAPGDLARKTARGVLTSVAGQAANFALRIVSMMVIARLVTPEHFGLVGMVTAFTGLLSLFRDAGLSAATVQRETISEELVSALFWINVAVGTVLAVLTIAAAPVLAAFYGDPRLVWITIALATGFVFNGVMAQHRALLVRRMQFGTLTKIDLAALIASIGLAIASALAGLGYWSLVVMTVSLPLITVCLLWMASGWTPGRPRRAAGIGSMLHYGGVITLNSLVMYVAHNTDKVLLGRFFGPEVLGLYGRAYQLISLPTDNLHTTLSWVMFPALSRVQSEPTRLRSYFLKGFALFLSVVTPITVACGLFAADIVHVFLGPQWDQAVPVFRLLAPTILALSMINPLGQLMQASGHAVRSLKVAFVIAPIVILGYALGLSYGPQGVAFGFSMSMLLLVAPVAYWARKGTLITMLDIARTVVLPCLSTLAGAIAAVIASQALSSMGALPRLVILTAILFSIHLLVLAFVLGQKQIYAELLHKVLSKRSSGVPAETKGEEGEPVLPSTKHDFAPAPHGGGQ
jgi:PST family polysaccharide transporter